MIEVSEVEARVYQCPKCDALPGCYCERIEGANACVLLKCHAARRKVAREHANYTDERKRENHE